MGPKGTLDRVRGFLKEVDLEDIGKKDPSQYACMLDDLTKALQRSLPRGARKWGVARKCLNLFFRDALYNFYLRNEFRLAKFEAQMEIPLDSYVGHALREENESLPRWQTVSGLTPKVSARFQAVALEVAKRRGTQRVHLDVEYWRRDAKSEYPT